ncbi:MAG: flavodoxin family protein [Raoultibacter sp.]|jgi:multimeric flavodoxin WrbA
MKKLIINASPRIDGRSAQLTTFLLASFAEENPAFGLVLFELAEHYLDGCIACDECKDDYECIIDDDMQVLYPLLDEADELVVVSPVFFAGPPSQLKALLDRLQPYYWKRMRESSQAKRPARLFVLGEGGDPHGFAPLVISARSALAVAGFSLDEVYDGRRLQGEELDNLARFPELYRVERADFDKPIPPGFQGEADV